MSEPLPSKYRASTLNDFIGQPHLVGENGPIKKFIENGKLPSIIFWGPPGTGKTTLAYIISKSLNADFHKLSAVMSGKDSLRKIIKVAMKNLKENKQTILFLDEIHRWNKAQQDGLLPYVEKGVITLIGATTENPSFNIIPALLSRVRVFTLNKHTIEDVKKFLIKLIEISKEEIEIHIKEDALDLISAFADGDLRTAGNILESAMNYSNGKEITKDDLKKVFENFLQYEARGEDHYNIISAIHKSLRDSDPNAGVYWVMRMLEAGDDPLYVCRRLLRFASEDIGNADPQALILANSVYESCQKIGLPECKIFIVQLAIYLAKAPKSNQAYSAMNEAAADVKTYGSLPVPMHLRNAPTNLMKELGYGKGYKYAHDFKDAKVDQEHFPEELKDRKYLKEGTSSLGE